MNKKILMAIGLIVLAAAGIAIFYTYSIGNKDNSVINSDNTSFILGAAQSPAVEGNIVNSGIAGKVVLLGGGPYEYEASLEIFLASDLSKPFISVRSHSDGSFQVPLRPGDYVLKPIDPDGPIAPAKESYNFTIGSGQWLQTRVEYISE